MDAIRWTQEGGPVHPGSGPGGGGRPAAGAPAAVPTGRRPLVDIVSGSFGAGHDAAAWAIAEQLHGEGYSTRVFDIVDLLPRPWGASLRAAYLEQVRHVPSAYSWLAGYTQRRAGSNRMVVRAMSAAHRALLEIAADGAVTTVSTHPMASQALGDLRAARRLATPVVTYLTDLSVHRVWVHAHVDRHLALHELTAAAAARLGARRVLVVRPAVAGVFTAPQPPGSGQAEARRGFGLPVGRRLVLVTGGSCGIGALEESALDVAASGQAVPVVLCGRNERLRRRLRRLPGVMTLGWVADMPRLLRAVDAVVQNAGGSTSLEALAAGVPVITYRCIAGHGRSNADALDRAELVPWVRTASALGPALARALTSGGGARPQEPYRPRVVDALRADPVQPSFGTQGGSTAGGHGAAESSAAVHRPARVPSPG